MPWLVGAGEVADKRAPPDCTLLRQLIREFLELPRGQAEARHPGIDMQHRRQPAVPPRDLCPVGDLTGFVEDRNELVEDELLCRPGQRSIQNRYLARRRKRTAQRHSLVERSDKKEPASRSGKNGGHLWRTQAVRIRLDDRRATRRFDPRNQRPPIRNDAREIDLGKVFELCRLRVETEFDRSDRAMPLLCYNDLAYAVNFPELLLPVLITLVEFLIGFVGAADRLTRLVVFLAEDEHDHVGILLDRARFAQVSEHRPLVVALLDRTRQLRERKHWNIELLCQRL